MSPHHPRRRFGQHFLADPGVISAIVDAVRPSGNDTIVEIGPGHGAITHPIIARCGRFHAVELDRDLAAALAKRYAANERVTVHNVDALDFDFTTLGGGLRLVGNLPYNISTPLLFHLLGQRDAIADMHFMLQKEVVDRIAAAPGSKAYGRLTIMLRCYLEVVPLFDVAPQAFEPPPAVTSAVVRLRPLPEDEIELTDAGALSALLATAFSRRRKTLRNALSGSVGADLLDRLGIDPGLRPEAVPIADWVRLANHLADNTDNASASR